MNREFWKDTACRCAWTFVEAMLSCMTIGQEITDINWSHALSISAVAALYTFLKQVAKHFKGMSVEDETAAIIAREMRELATLETAKEEEPDDSFIIEDEDEDGGEADGEE